MPKTPSPPVTALPLIGWKEWVALPDLGIPAVKAKIDTGARTSALHTFNLEAFRKGGTDWVRFSVHPLQRRLDVVRECAAIILDHRSVKNSGGRTEERFVVQTRLELGPLSWPIELTLTNRAGMRFRMLLGRTAIRGCVWIDPGRAYLFGRRGVKAYGISPQPPKRKRTS